MTIELGMLAIGVILGIGATAVFCLLFRIELRDDVDDVDEHEGMHR